MRFGASLIMRIANYANQLLKYCIVFNFLLFKFIECNEGYEIEKNCRFKSHIKRDIKTLCNDYHDIAKQVKLNIFQIQLFNYFDYVDIFCNYICILRIDYYSYLERISKRVIQDDLYYSHTRYIKDFAISVFYFRSFVKFKNISLISKIL